MLRPGLDKVIWLFADLILTFFVALIAYTLGTATLDFLFFDMVWLDRIADYFAFFFPTLTVVSNPAGNQDAVMIYSTFLTSIWLWAFLLSAVLTKALYVMPFFFKLANKVLNLDAVVRSSPLQVLGYPLIAGATVVFGALLMLGG